MKALRSHVCHVFLCGRSMSYTSIPTSRIVFGVVELSSVLLNFRLAGAAARMLVGNKTLMLVLG